MVRVRLELLPTLAKGQKKTRKVTAKFSIIKNDEKPLNFVSRTGSSPVAASKIVVWWNR